MASDSEAASLEPGATRGRVEWRAHEMVDAYEVISDSPRRLMANALTVVLSVVVYILAADALGFIPTMFLVLLAIQRVLGSRWLPAALTASGTTAALYLVFEKLLLVQLPDGIVGL